MHAHARPDHATDARHMARAIELAWRGWGRVQPNPLVGAVVTDASGSVVAEGWHAEFGGAHAEAAALERAGGAARGGTLYVTLEPCAHHGKTPPCTDAVLRSGVARVVIAVADPNRTAAGGSARLRAAGIDVAVGTGAREAEDQNAPFLHWHRTGRPFVALKLGTSLDARIAARAGETTDVTGPAARAAVHRLRAGYDAILVGRRTAEVDDPLLTARGAVEPRRPPIRIVLDSDARLDPAGRLASDTRVAPTWLFAAPEATGNASALAARGVRVARARRAPGGGLDLDDVLHTLAAADVRSVFCEGGGVLASALLSADRVDRLYLFVAPKLFGPDAPAAFPAFRGGAAGRAWRLVRSDAHDDDVLLELARA
ncbi:MAG TPA: bifunctional diaminohydroxyphosphoribosylaminopyrimidine deaminase/5-amino-6-(5-phosphoribosylamino)uracil reductase RibD [Longimicrobiales bacterium]